MNNGGNFQEFLEVQNTRNILILLKANENLIKPSFDVINICKTAERILKCYIASNKIYEKNVKFIIETKIKNAIYAQTFLNMQEHTSGQDILNNHRSQLFDSVVKMYTNIRMHFCAKWHDIHATTERKKLSRLIIFKNQ